MKHILPVAAVLALAGCTQADQTKIQTALSSPAGQLFCGIATASGPIVAGMIQAGVSGAAGAAAPIAIIATGQAKAYVDATCAAAGGVPVSPPANPAAVPQIAVVPPAVTALSGVRQ